ncbi:MAG: hypothetical protein ACI9BV_004020 [Rhodothermales bacterium]|jgi:hypothetical protein
MLFVQTSNCLFSRSGNEAVLLDIESGSYFGLNEVGTVIWEALSSPASAEALCGHFQTQGINLDVCRGPVERFLLELEKQGLIRRAPDVDSEAGVISSRLSGLPAIDGWSDPLLLTAGLEVTQGGFAPGGSGDDAFYSS